MNEDHTVLETDSIPISPHSRMAEVVGFEPTGESVASLGGVKFRCLSYVVRERIAAEEAAKEPAAEAPIEETAPTTYEDLRTAEGV